MTKTRSYLYLHGVCNLVEEADDEQTNITPTVIRDVKEIA